MNLPRPRSSVVLKDVSEGAILFCTDTEIYFSLNQAGVRIWRLLYDCASESEILEQLGRDHPEVALETIRADLRALLTELSKHRLVEGREAA